MPRRLPAVQPLAKVELMTEQTFALLYAVLWAGMFAFLFRLTGQSRQLQQTIRQIKKYLHSGWPDPQ